jgi:hypothetical protein
MMPGARRMLLIRALGALLAWRMGLWIFPLRFLLEGAREPAGSRGRSAHGPASSVAVEMIAWAVAAAARYVPGATCLVQALAAQSMLRRGGYASELHIGVAKGPDRSFGAHAWLRCGGRVVLGGSGLGQYTPLIFWEAP